MGVSLCGLHHVRSFVFLFATRFVTPDQKYVVDNTPHTPTPFKNALEKYGPIRPLVSIGQVCHWQVAET